MKDREGGRKRGTGGERDERIERKREGGKEGRRERERERGRERDA